MIPITSRKWTKWTTKCTRTDTQIAIGVYGILFARQYLRPGNAAMWRSAVRFLRLSCVAPVFVTLGFGGFGRPLVYRNYLHGGKRAARFWENGVCPTGTRGRFARPRPGTRAYWPTTTTLETKDDEQKLTKLFGRGRGQTLRINCLMRFWLVWVGCLIRFWLVDFATTRRWMRRFAETFANFVSKIVVVIGMALHISRVN